MKSRFGYFDVTMKSISLIISKFCFLISKPGACLESKTVTVSSGLLNHNNPGVYNLQNRVKLFQIHTLHENLNSTKNCLSPERKNYMGKITLKC